MIHNEQDLKEYVDDAIVVHEFYKKYIDDKYTYDKLRQGDPIHFRESDEYPTFKRKYTTYIRLEKIKQLMNENSTNN